MIRRWYIGSIKITLTVARVVKVGGFNSTLTDGNHILMWDMDDTDLETVKAHLIEVQRYYKLPKIYILETKPGANFVAYCFKRVSWQKAISIIAQTKGVDWSFVKWGIFRDGFTLRATDKGHGKPHLVATLLSKMPEDAIIKDLATWVKYETLADKAKYWREKRRLKDYGVTRL